MFPALITLAAIYLFCAVLLHFFAANAPEAFEDESGFHYVGLDEEADIFAPGKSLQNS